MPNTPTWHRKYASSLSVLSCADKAFDSTQLLLNMDLVVHNFSKALRYGTKFLYQSLPRLLTIWLDFAARDEFRNYDPGKGQEVTQSGRDKCVRLPFRSSSLT